MCDRFVDSDSILLFGVCFVGVFSVVIVAVGVVVVVTGLIHLRGIHHGHLT